MELIVEGLQVMVIGMGVVFVVLYFLSLILRLFKSLFYQKDLKPTIPASVSQQISKTQLIEEENLENDLLVISIVMAQLLTGNKYHINIKQIT